MLGRRRIVYLLWISGALSFTFFYLSLRIVLHSNNLTSWRQLSNHELKYFLHDSNFRDPSVEGKFASGNNSLEEAIREKQEIRKRTIGAMRNNNLGVDRNNFEALNVARTSTVEDLVEGPRGSRAFTGPEISEPPSITEFVAVSTAESAISNFSRNSSEEISNRRSAFAAAPTDSSGIRLTGSSEQVTADENLIAVARMAALLPLPKFDPLYVAEQLPVVDGAADLGLEGSDLLLKCVPAKSDQLDFTAFQHALLYGRTNGKPQTKSDFLDRLRRSSSPWISHLDGHFESDAFSMLWLGCFDGPEPSLAPMVVASKYQRASVMVVHACLDEANVTVLEAARDELELSNLLIFPSASSQRLGEHEDDDSLSAWRAIRPNESIEPICDTLVLSPGAISTLLLLMLPSDVESALANVLSWCSKSVLIDQYVFQSKPWKVSSLWVTSIALVEASLSRLSDSKAYSAHSTTNEATSLEPNGVRITVVDRNMSYPDKDQNESGGINRIKISTLHSMFGITENEGVRTFTNALIRGSSLACIVAGQRVEFYFHAGTLFGCNIGSIEARRQRVNTISFVKAFPSSNYSHFPAWNSSVSRRIWGRRKMKLSRNHTQLNSPIMSVEDTETAIFDSVSAPAFFFGISRRR